MPTYQYACINPDCGERFELVQSFTDPAASECPVCGGPVRKVFSAVGVVFKGSGFYRTDSRADASSGFKTSASSDSSKSDSKSDAKASESKSTESKSSDSSGSASSSSSSSKDGSSKSGGSAASKAAAPA